MLEPTIAEASAFTCIDDLATWAGLAGAPRTTLFSLLGVTGAEHHRCLGKCTEAAFDRVLQDWRIEGQPPKPAVLAQGELLGLAARVATGAQRRTNEVQQSNPCSRPQVPAASSLSEATSDAEMSGQKRIGSMGSMRSIMENPRVSVRATRSPMLMDVDIHREVQDTLKKADSNPGREKISLLDHMRYEAENYISANPKRFFLMVLIGLTSFLITVLGVLWKAARGWDLSESEVDAATLPHSFFFAIQVMAAGCADRGLPEGVGPAIVYVLLLFSGLVILAILIGMITEEFETYMHHVGEGRSKVTASGHTLILGWNETTVRVVCNIAFLRRVYRQQNKTWVRTILRWKRLPATTPVAVAPIILMNNQMTKTQMHEAIDKAFQQRGISDTRLGRDVVCRVGDPTDLHDLWRVGAHRATSVLLQMNEADHQEEQEHRGTVSNGMTLRVLLGLRVALFSAVPAPSLEELRVVAQLSAQTKAIEVVSLGEDSKGRSVLTMQDLSVFLNSLMFNCTRQPGLSQALLEILGFDGTAIRLRKVNRFPHGGKHIIGKTFRELALAFEDGVPIGFVSSETGEDGIACEGPEEARVGNAEPEGRGGMAPLGDRKICADDRLIFVSHTNMPSAARTCVEAIETKGEAAELCEPAPAHVLVCGWRAVWDVPSRFAFRIRDAAEDLPPDSSITFLCTKGQGMEGAFKSFMDEVCQSDEGIKVCDEEEEVWMFEDSVKVRYIAGDAAKYNTLHYVLKSAVTERSTTFQQAIIMSTMANEKLSPFSRDTRVISIMLFLRHLQVLYRQEPMHIIGENSMDSTSYLAMGPVASKGAAAAIDFVNVHALYARVLAQFLAYPRMGPALSQLFAGRPGMPSIRLESARGRIPADELTFGTLVRLHKELFPEDVLLGIRQTDGSMVITPPLSEVLDCSEEPLLILITRRLTKDQMRTSTHQGRSSLESQEDDLAKFLPEFDEVQKAV